MSGAIALRIDIVSDVVCPWCIIGYKQVQKALGSLDENIEAEIWWHPFELNPQMVPEGQDIGEHIKQKYHEPPPVVMMITAYGDAENYNTAKRLGADDFLTKPVDFISLKQKLKINN